MRIVVITGETMGQGDADLGRKLIGSFLRKLWACSEKPDVIVFYNSGVKLMARGSGVLDALTGLAETGVDLVACGTCVSFFDLKDSIAVGRVSDMGEIVRLLVSADRTVSV